MNDRMRNPSPDSSGQPALVRFVDQEQARRPGALR
jgi:hypothetical protein